MTILRKHILPLISIIATSLIFKHGMIYLNSRQGSIFPDPIHAMFPAVELHWPIFFVTYLPIILGIILLFPRTESRLDLIYSYCMLQLLRLTSIFLIPLEAPPGMIVLNDPIADHLVFGTVVTKDLFFSGHVSTLCLLAFLMPTKKWKLIFVGLAITDAVLLTAQHVHYSIDVAAAPFFAYGIYRFRQYLKNRSIFRGSLNPL